jgi:hypothetical protein
VRSPSQPSSICPVCRNHKTKPAKEPDFVRCASCGLLRRSPRSNRRRTRCRTRKAIRRGAPERRLCLISATFNQDRTRSSLFARISANLEDAAAKRCNEHSRSCWKSDLLDGVRSRPALGNFCSLGDRRFASSRLDDIHANRDGRSCCHLERWPRCAPCFN